ncbi:MarR family winged helix-turn-helix transcriptional regulator [Desulfovibrio sp. UCD-KL4C]|uniref:MarR family winged helix-turn-helix transcriptional regulator n=1 Tax=Desulfovibrio sp. UCD-KL4C TaxID=2578120 RepID=UPI0025C59159|nr:MarR family winged helix-turn-helix transcriptional regulator [Desulfovibrio sp. UCD-KL4C]
MILVEKISSTSKRFKSFGTDVDIYRSEIHIIQLIGDRSELYISEIARLIGVTKGTISQIVKRLEAKELVKKSIDLNNNTKQLVSLTSKGIVAYKAHVDYHNYKHKEMEHFLSTLNDEHLTTLKQFLNKAYEMIDDHL